MGKAAKVFIVIVNLVCLHNAKSLLGGWLCICCKMKMFTMSFFERFVIICLLFAGFF